MTLGLASTPVSNPYFGDLVQSIERSARAAGYSLVLGDTHDAPDQTLPCAPEVQQRCVALRAHLVLQAAQGREPLAVFAHLGRARGTHRRQSAFEFSSQLHARRL